MKKLIAVLILLTACRTDVPPTHPSTETSESECEIENTFIQNAQTHLLVERDRWKDYPTPPLPTCEVYRGLQIELTDPELAALFEKFSKDQHQRLEALPKLKMRNAVFALLALSVHGNPDIRVYATRNLRDIMATKALTNFSAEGLVAFEAKEREVFRFLLHVMEKTPHAISGSENSTIHGIYVSNLASTLDLIRTGKLTTDRYSSITEKNITAWTQHLATMK